MKILVLNGSPRRGGVVDTILERVLEAAGKKGCTGEKLNVCDLKLRPCTGCMACRTDGVCRLSRDDAHEAAEKIAEADLLVVGTPTYWGNMSGQLKLLFDRTVPVFMGESSRGIPQGRQRGKRALIVAACTTPWPFNRLMRQSRGAVGAVREVLGTAGYRIRTLQIGGTKRISSLPERCALRAERTIRHMIK